MEWLLALLFGTGAAVADATPDYVGQVAAEVAYASVQVDTNPAVKPKVPRNECKTCNATGRVRSGDGQGWTKCPDCEPPPGEVPQPPRAEMQSGTKFQTSAPLRSQ
jgi:hypothetical protein